MTGVPQFPGRIMHAHDFREANEFAGKRLLLIGASYSAEDIALQCLKYGAKSIVCSWRSKPMGFKWPKEVEERPLVQVSQQPLLNLDSNQPYVVAKPNCLRTSGSRGGRQLSRTGPRPSSTWLCCARATSTNMTSCGKLN